MLLLRYAGRQVPRFGHRQSDPDLGEIDEVMQHRQAGGRGWRAKQSSLGIKQPDGRTKSKSNRPQPQSSRGVTVIILALIVMAQLFSSPVSTVYGLDDEGEHATVGEWITLLILSILYTAILLVIAVARHQHKNPHTRLPKTVKRRRARGPLRRQK
jgi:hypothetical protein